MFVCVCANICTILFCALFTNGIRKNAQLNNDAQFGILRIPNGKNKNSRGLIMNIANDPRKTHSAFCAVCLRYLLCVRLCCMCI